MFVRMRSLRTSKTYVLDNSVGEGSLRSICMTWLGDIPLSLNNSNISWVISAMSSS